LGALAGPPVGLGRRGFYRPGERGHEKRFAERLAQIEQWQRRRREAAGDRRDEP
jgi:hypothetical protein